ncbi:MAG TPA: hypothetical protein DCS09_12725 [Porphyromonadaceae bacterium]|nr:hypothetical protein [Porphyromonadaceae bacterium]
MEAVAIELPFPPTINHYYRRNGAATFISEEGQMYRETVFGLLAEAGVQTFRGKVSLTLDLHPPDRRIRDIDNYQKPLLDALEKGRAYNNDNQVKRLLTIMHEPDGRGRVLVAISKLGKQRS